MLDPPAELSGPGSRDSAAPSTIPVGQIRPNPYQPRRDLLPAALQSLAESIRKTGIIQPILVRAAAPEVYELIAGERRWRAAQMAGLHLRQNDPLGLPKPAYYGH
jgi:ParB family chromosome partitioning protein